MTTMPPPQSTSWSTIVPQTSRSNRTAIHRAIPSTSSPTIAFNGCHTLYEALRRGLSLSPLGPCLGFRAVSSTGYPTPFVYATYTEVVARVNALAAGLERLDLLRENEDGMKLLGFYVGNCVEWTVAEHATFSCGGVTVPFYATLGADTVGFILEQTGTATVLASRKEMEGLVDAKRGGQCPYFQNVILIDGVTPEAAESAHEVGLTLYSFAKVEAVGGQVISSEGHKHSPPSGRDVATFCYTSGTTGNPKGALLTHTNIIAAVAGLNAGNVTLEITDRHLSYMPMAHIMERVIQAGCLASGTSVGFFRGDVTLLIEDIVACRPTLFIAAPRVLNKIHDKIMAGVMAAGGIKAKLFQAALATKRKNLATKNQLTHSLYDPLVFLKIKKALGLDHVRLLISGSAPLSAPVMTFFRCLLSNPVVEGYGQTEGAAAATIADVEDMSTAGHVGGPHFSCEICLEDVPEMGYYSTDKMHRGEACVGRGEVLIRGPNIFKGYYKMEEATRETVDEEGWLHSGDIGLWTPQGHLKIIDRKKNIFKLAQGEYVAPEKIENVIGHSSLVSQAFVHGDSLQRYLVAVIVPDEDVVKNTWAPQRSLSGRSFKELCESKELKQDVMESITKVARESGLLGFEIPRAIRLESDLFSVDNGLLTPTMKVKRKQLRDKYEGLIEEMYEEINAGHQSKL